MTLCTQAHVWIKFHAANNNYLIMQLFQQLFPCLKVTKESKKEAAEKNQIYEKTWSFGKPQQGPGPGDLQCNNIYK